ncbi:hypothetical protein NST08_14360 [Paenibacillus sp. FSL K6-1566]|uniref:hypothetical protein n=1 Tax=Paenibacillus sp. FSL K6-1566 TaxID=2954515 RepID=UPI0031014785
MKLLSHEQTDRAKQYMLTQARALEAALYRYEFEGGSFSEVLEELSRYQNDDGGFGHGLEPDLRCKESSALATTRALELLRLDGTGEGEEMVIRTLGYLERTYIPERFGWDIIPKEAEQSPRAIWWKYGAFADHWGNPNADIAAYFMDYRALCPFGPLDSVIRYALDYLREACDLTEMHELFCYLRFKERLPEEQALDIQELLERYLDNCISSDPAEREGYGATALSIMDSPNSPYYKKYKAMVPLELDLLVETQGEDGAWEPNWTWYQYDEVWPLAKEEWKGILTLNALRTLRNFKRIETVQ